MFTVLGYIGAVVVLASYWISVRKSNPTVFHWGNVIGSLLMIGGVVVAGVWYSAAVTATFGMIGAYGLVTTYMKREKVSPAVKLLSAPARDLGSAEAFVPEEATHMLTDEMRFALRGQTHLPKGPVSRGSVGHVGHSEAVAVTSLNAYWTDTSGSIQSSSHDCGSSSSFDSGSSCDSGGGF